MSIIQDKENRMKIKSIFGRFSGGSDRIANHVLFKVYVED